MNTFVRTPSFTATHPGAGTQEQHGGPSPVAKVAPSHPKAPEKAVRLTLHLPPDKQRQARRSWPFLGSLAAMNPLNR